MGIKIYFKFFPIILTIVTLIGLFNIFRNFPKYLIGGGLIASVTLIMSFVLFSKVNPSSVPDWYKKIIHHIPPLVVGIILLFLIIINSTVTIPIFLVYLPIGSINAFVLSIALVVMLQYKTGHKNQIFVLKTILTIYLIISFILIMAPSVKTVLTGTGF